MLANAVDTGEKETDVWHRGHHEAGKLGEAGCSWSIMPLSHTLCRLDGSPRMPRAP